MYESMMNKCMYGHIYGTRITYGGWRDESDGTALQTQDSKYEPSRPEAEHATCTYWSRRLPTILDIGLRRQNISGSCSKY